MKTRTMRMKDVGRVYDSLITFQKKIPPQGGKLDLDAYEYYVDAWVETRYLKGRNLYAARAANIKTDLEFIIRHREDIDETMRIKHNNKLYNIDGILPLENERLYMVIRAHEIQNNMYRGD